MIKTRHGLDLTEGRISTLLLRFATPFMLANLITGLYGIVGMLVVARYTDPATIAGVATGTQIMNLTFSFMFGLGTGGTVLIGRCIGERNEENGTKATGSYLIISAILIIFLTSFIGIFREPLLDMLKTPPVARASASRYVMICTLGVPFNIGYGMLSAIFRGMGNSNVPSIVVGISCAVNITLSFTLVIVAGLAEAGVAIATVTAQFISFVLIAVLLYRKKLPFPFGAKDIRPEKKPMSFIITVGIPIVLQELLITISFMILTNRVNSISVEASASVGIVARTFVLAFVLINGLGSAVSAMTAQNLGAGKRDRAMASLRWGILYALIIGVSVFAFCVTSPETLTEIFSANDEVVMKGAASYLRAYSFEAVMVAFIFCMNAYLGGCGKSKVAMIHSILSVVILRVPLGVLVTGIQGIGLNTMLTYLGISGPIASVLSLVVCIVYITRQERKYATLEA